MPSHAVCRGEGQTAVPACYFVFEPEGWYCTQIQTWLHILEAFHVRAEFVGCIPNRPGLAAHMTTFISPLVPRTIGKLLRSYISFWARERDKFRN